MNRETKWVQIFASGKHPAMSGTVVEFSNDDLQELCDAFTESLGSNHRVPAVLGHPQHDDPAYGWLSRVKRDGTKLFGKFKDVTQDLAEWVKTGKYKSISPRIYPREHPSNPTPGKLNLAHIGFLGALQPAAKGMEPVEFGEQEGILYFEFSDRGFAELPLYSLNLAFQGIYQILQNLRDRELAKAGESGADEVKRVFDLGYLNNISSIELEGLKGIVTVEELARLWERLWQLEDMLENREVRYDMSEQRSEDLAELQASLANLQSENKRLISNLEASQGRIAALEQESQQAKRAIEIASIANFVEAAIREKKVLPADRDKKIKFLLALPSSSDAAIDFGEGEAKTPRQAAMDEISDRNPLWSNSKMPTDPQDSPMSFSEGRNDNGYDRDSVLLDQKIRQHAIAKGMNPNKTEDYSEAWGDLIRIGQA